MKKAEISSSMLVFIIIAIVAMTLFILFFTGTGQKLFGQFGQIGPSDSETAKNACQIACNQAKVNKDCIWWCSELYGDGPGKCYKHVDCDFKDAEGKTCACP